MSNAILFHIDADGSHPDIKSRAGAVANKGRESGAKFATYVPVDGDGSGATIILHGPEEAEGAAHVESLSREHSTAGFQKLAASPLGVKAVKGRTVNISHHGNPCGAKPYALLFCVNYDPAKAGDLKAAAEAIKSHNPSLRYHVIRKDGVAGSAMVAVPVDSLDQHDKQVSDAAGPIVEQIKGAVTNVDVVKLKRVEHYSA